MGEHHELVSVEFCERCGIVIGGQLDLLTAPFLIDAAAELTGSDGIDVDMRTITFMDASGVRALLRLKHSLPSAQVVAESAPVGRVLKITGTYYELVAAGDFETNTP